MTGSTGEEMNIGEKRGPLTIIERIETAIGVALWRVRCDCGAERTFNLNEIIRCMDTGKHGAGCSNRVDK
jgi:hypothetical protein